MARVIKATGLPWRQLVAAGVAAWPLATDAIPPIARSPSPAAAPAPKEAAPLTPPAASDPSPPVETPAGGTPDPNPAGPNQTDPNQEGKGFTGCPPEAPYLLGPKLCGDQTLIDQINSGWQITVDPKGNITLNPPPHYDPATQQWGRYDTATQACNPAIEVKLKQAALAGSQLTRAISDRQMNYPQVDPIEAVNNPRKEGYGGVCTIDLFAFDLGRLLGSTYEQIKNLIDTLSNLSVDHLFGAACRVVNTVFGNLQNQLLQELQTHSPLTPVQQFVNTLTVGYVLPLQSLLSYGVTTRPTPATAPGILTVNPLKVSYVPEKGYVYMADFGSNNLLVVHISQTPLAPGDAAASTGR